MLLSSPLPPSPADVLGPGHAPRWAPLRHVLLAGGLGVLVAVVGFPALLMATFGGGVALLVVVAVELVLACVLAVALDRTAGPGAYARFRYEGSAERGVALGCAGSLGLLALGALAWRADLDADLANGWLYAGAGLPFLLVAALQWPGLPRIAGVVLLAGVAALTVVHADALERTVRGEPGAPTPPATLAERMGAAGYPERPWMSDVPGHHASDAGTGQLGGVYTRYVPDDLTATSWGVLVTALPATAVPGDDPCAAPTFPSPYGVLATASCTPTGPGVWSRTGAADAAADVPGGADVVTQRDGRWIAVSGDPSVSPVLLATMLDGAAPMTDAELDHWLTRVGIPSPEG